MLPASMATVSLMRYEVRYWTCSAALPEKADGISVTFTRGHPP